MSDEVNCTILQEYLDIEDDQGVDWENATDEQLDRNVPQAHQKKIVFCGQPNARSCPKTACASHKDHKEK